MSIGLCENGRPVLGVVYDPYRDEVFLAVTGQVLIPLAICAGERE